MMATAQASRSYTPSHIIRERRGAGAGMRATAAITRWVKSARGSSSDIRARRCSTTIISSANVRQPMQPSRCACTCAAAPCDSVPSAYADSRSLHAEHFTIVYLRQRSLGARRGRVARAELARERGLPAMDQRLDVSERHAHRIGDLLIVHVLVVTKDQCGAHLFRNALQGDAQRPLVVAAQNLSIRCGRRALIGKLLVQRLILIQVFRRRAAAVFHELRPRRIARDLIEPGGELGERRVEGAQMGVCPQEGLLADVVGFFGRADQGIDEVENTPFVPLDERCESVLVSSQDERDELLIRLLPNNGGSSVVC